MDMLDYGEKIILIDVGAMVEMTSVERNVEPPTAEYLLSPEMHNIINAYNSNSKYSDGGNVIYRELNKIIFNGIHNFTKNNLDYRCDFLDCKHGTLILVCVPE